VACAQIGVTFGHLELCGARGKLGSGWFLSIGCGCRLISVYLCHNIVFTRKFPLLGLTVIVVELSVFLKLTICTLAQFQ